jgi:hypothetical protein
VITYIHTYKGPENDKNGVSRIFVKKKDSVETGAHSVVKGGLGMRK